MRLINADALLQKFNDKGIQITFDLPVEEILGEDVDIDDFTMLVQDAIQAYRKMVIGTIQEQPTAYDQEKVVAELEERSKEYNSGVRLHGKPEEMLTYEAIEIVKRGGCGMKASELIAQCENKPMRMPMCRECMGKSKKDCQPNPLNCVDFCICNHEKLKELGFDVFGK